MVLRRHGRSRLRLPALEAAQNYERSRHLECAHVDIERLGRFLGGRAILCPHVDSGSRHAGWRYVHLAVDDHSRRAYGELLASERPAHCAAFLRRTTASYRSQSVIIERGLTEGLRRGSTPRAVRPAVCDPPGRPGRRRPNVQPPCAGWRGARQLRRRSELRRGAPLQALGHRLSPPECGTSIRRSAAAGSRSVRSVVSGTRSPASHLGRKSS